ncbi:MAG: hypothetical protein ABI977_12555 [Acidobacteriota bacterium]
MPVEDIAIVLTGTIIPNAPFTAHNDPQVRRREYLEAIRFYRQFAPVYFLENSSYALGDDAEFNAFPDVMIRQRPTSIAPQRGKGYQEFEMIDGWLMDEPRPPRRWVKITGRYLYQNFASLLVDCRRQPQARILIDQCARSRKARGYLFCVETEFYRERIAGAYRECDDASGNWIEYVLYNCLSRVPDTQVRLFAEEPQLRAISGSTGGDLETPPVKFAVKRVLRWINYFFDEQRLWYTH